MKNVKDFNDYFSTMKTPYFIEDEKDTLETYGEELDYVLAFIAKSPDNIKHVFTIIDGDDNNLYAIAGYHLVNRINYIITNEMWVNEDEQYMWSEFDVDVNVDYDSIEGTTERFPDYLNGEGV